MRAVSYAAFQAAPEVVALPDPPCPGDGVVLEVDATGLCGSDWHGWMGHDPDIALPHVPGHEFAGRIVEVGPQTRSWRPGDRVTASFVGACGRCAACRRGQQQVCDDQVQVGFHRWGSFAEHVAVPRAEHNLVRVPDDIALEVAALLGCRFGTAYRALVHQGRAREGDWVVVHGCGGVGLSAVMIARARGARVIAVDVAPAARDLAHRLGAEVTLDGGREDLVAAIRQATSGGANVSIDAFGSAQSALASIRSLGKRGRHVQVGLLAERGGEVGVPMAAVLSAELEILGSHGMPAHDFPEMITEIRSGGPDPGRLIERRVGLSAAARLLAAGAGTAGPGVTIIDPHST
jgi:alcohol dehydrogenase